jgi:hypothetical protein
MNDSSLPLIEVSVPDLIPDTRARGSTAEYSQPTCLTDLVGTAAEVYGLVSDLDQRGTEWLRWVAMRPHNPSVVLVLALYPGCRTWEDVLADALEIQESTGRRIHFSMLGRRIGPARPANLLWLRSSKHDPGTAIIGNLGNFLAGVTWDLTDAVMTVPLTTASAETLRQWMDWIQLHSTPLTKITVIAPQLVPPDGTEEGRRQWNAYIELLDRNLLNACDGRTVEVDPRTGEVSAEDKSGNPLPTLTSSGTLPKVDPVLKAVQKILNDGKLVSIDRVGRPPPFDAPLPPEMFGERRDDRTGAIRRRQQFTISLFDDEARKVLDNRRNDAPTRLSRFSLMLQEGQRWMPNAAFPLFEKELDDAAQKAMKALGTATNNSAPEDFVKVQRQKIQNDCQNMLTQLGRRTPPDQTLLEKVLADLLARLEGNLATGMRAKLGLGSYQLVDSPREDLQPWGTIQTFLAGSARTVREALVSSFHFRGLVVDKQAFVRAFDLFRDPLIGRVLDGQPYENDANEQLRIIRLIEDETNSSAQSRSNALWKLIQGEGEVAVRAALAQPPAA